MAPYSISAGYPSVWKFCDKGGKVRASVSYGHISS